MQPRGSTSNLLNPLTVMRSRYKGDLFMMRWGFPCDMPAFHVPPRLSSSSPLESNLYRTHSVIRLHQLNPEFLNLATRLCVHCPQLQREAMPAIRLGACGASGEAHRHPGREVAAQVMSK
jgi:hypothetical protein